MANKRKYHESWDLFKANAQSNYIFIYSILY